MGTVLIIQLSVLMVPDGCYINKRNLLNYNNHGESPAVWDLQVRRV